MEMGGRALRRDGWVEPWASRTPQDHHIHCDERCKAGETEYHQGRLIHGESHERREAACKQQGDTHTRCLKHLHLLYFRRWR